MGRYTTVQTYTDKDAKVAAIAYSTAVSSGDASAASSAAAASAGAATEVPSGGDASKRDGDEKSTAADDRFSTARVDNVSGSSAGAGSGDFHMYRAARRRELDRVERMENDYKKRIEQEEFEAKRKRNLSEFESRAAKRAEKRRKRKDRAKSRTLDQALSDGEGDGDEAKTQDDAQKKSADGEKPLPETPGGVPEIANDGSFLERMLALQKQQEQGGDATENKK